MHPVSNEGELLEAQRASQSPHSPGREAGKQEGKAGNGLEWPAGPGARLQLCLCCTPGGGGGVRKEPGERRGEAGRCTPPPCLPSSLASQSPLSSPPPTTTSSRTPHFQKSCQELGF